MNVDDLIIRYSVSSSQFPASSRARGRARNSRLATGHWQLATGNWQLQCPLTELVAAEGARFASSRLNCRFVSILVDPIGQGRGTDDSIKSDLADAESSVWHAGGGCALFVVGA